MSRKRIEQVDKARKIRKFVRGHTTFRREQVTIIGESMYITLMGDSMYLEEVTIPMETVESIEKGDGTLKVHLINGYVEFYSDTIEIINVTIC